MRGQLLQTPFSIYLSWDLSGIRTRLASFIDGAHYLGNRAHPRKGQGMSIQALPETTAIRTAVSRDEWEVRVELAAAHRLMAHFGIQDLTHNHLTARVPGEPGHFLIKAPDAMFDEVSASNLVKYDFDGNPQQDGHAKLRGGGLIIHAGLFAARDDLNVVFHTHTPSIIGVASQKNGLLPINQHGIRFIGKIAYHEFGGFAAGSLPAPSLESSSLCGRKSTCSSPAGT